MKSRKFVTTAIVTVLASVGAVGLSSSPALAGGECPVFSDIRWHATACIDHTGTSAVGQGDLLHYPTSCAYFRVYVVAEGAGGDVLVKSTSALPCSSVGSATATVSIPTRTKSRIVAWNSAGDRILHLETAAYNGVD